jgi:carboxypeptidase family protein
MIRSILRSFSWVVLCCSVVCASAFAQNDRASITGRVTDPSGASVSGASVKVTNANTGATFDATTNDDGRFVVPSVLQVGIYKVEASKAGFKKAVSDNIELRIGDVREVNLALEVGATTEQVTVSAEAPLLNTETSSNGAVIVGRQVTELPIRDLNFTNLALLTPGVSRAITTPLTDSTYFNQGDASAGGNGSSNPQGDTPADRFGRSGGSAISANGLRSGNNNFTVDGVDNNEPIYGQIGVFPNPDAIQEFQVNTSMAKAESGRGGAQINTTYKSGTNEFHGTASYFGQNTALNAINPGIGAARELAILNSGGTETEAQAIASLPKTVTHINEFGGTLGGPIIKNKLFFFGDYQGQRNLIPASFQSATPTPGVHDGKGDFSAFCVSGFDSSGICMDRIPNDKNPPPAGSPCVNGDARLNCLISGQLYDPGTGGPSTASCTTFAAGTPFPNNVIPNPTCRADFSSVAQKYFNEFPLPNVPNVKAPTQLGGAPNYDGTRRNQETIDSFDVKSDYRFSDKNTLSGRYTRDNQTRIRANFFPVLPTVGFGAGNELGNTRQVVVTDTHIFKPTLLNEARFGYTSVELGIFNCGVEGACGISPTWCNDIGIPNCNKGTPATTGGALIGFGCCGPGTIEFTGDGGIFLEKSKSYYVGDSVTYIQGKHTWKGGIEIRPREIDQLDSGGFGDLKGAFGWGNGGVGCHTATSQNNVCSGHTGVNQADALLTVNADFSSSGTVGGGDNPFILKSTEYAFFIQDDWKATNNLTLNLGVRWDAFPLYGENTGRIGNFDPVTLTLNRAKGSGNSLSSTRKDNIGPRAGFAYAFGGKRQFALRGGVGTFFATEGFGGDYPLALNPPNVNQTGGPANFQIGPPVATVTDPPILTTGTTLYSIPSNFRNEAIYEGNLSVEYQFAQSYVFDVGYAGNRARHLLAERDLGSNANGLGSEKITTVNPPGSNFACAAPPCYLNDVRIFEGRANADYDSLQAKLEKRYSMGIVGTLAYTWSHARDNSSGLFGNPGEQRGNVGGPINAFNFNADRSDSSLDHRHTFVSSFLWDLPFGKGKKYAGGVNEMTDKFIGGWQWNVVLSGTTGTHFTVGTNGIPSNLVGAPYSNGVLNVASFTNGSVQANAGSICYTNLAGNLFCYGDSGRNHFTGPGYFHTDMSVFKNLSFTERLKMQLGLEAFNVFNQANALIPNTDPTQSHFGFFQNTWLPGRIVQYRVRIMF